MDSECFFEESEIFIATESRKYKNGRRQILVLTKCKKCQKERWVRKETITRALKNGTYTGLCINCFANRERPITMRNSRNPSGKRINEFGYVVVLKNSISDEELEFYYDVKQDRTTLLEHRWVMAKHLGRPLRSNELVDHMDGNKTNNSIENLRIYVKGNQDPGSHSGYGTFYHEWQECEAKIRSLNKILNSLPIF